MKKNPLMLVGLAGLSGVGKDTVAELLASHAGAETYAFADPVKLHAASILKLEPKYFYDRDLKEAVIPRIGLSPREILTKFGTDFVRQIMGDNIWIDHAETAYQKSVDLAIGTILDFPTAFVVTDVRYENEANWIRSQGGYIWHVTRKDALAVAKHCSEDGIEVTPADYKIENDGNLIDLWNATGEAFGICTNDFYGCDVKYPRARETRPVVH